MFWGKYGAFVRLSMLLLESDNWVRPGISGEAANTREADEAIPP